MKLFKEEKKPAGTLTLIATRNFRNTHPDIIKVEGALHANHVHKGAKFTVDLDNEDCATLVGLLDICGSVIDANDAESVERLTAEIEQEKKAAEADAARAKQFASDPIAQLRQLLMQGR